MDEDTTPTDIMSSELDRIVSVRSGSEIDGVTLGVGNKLMKEEGVIDPSLPSKEMEYSTVNADKVCSEGVIIVDVKNDLAESSSCIDESMAE